jgi:hypothetical protein
MNEAYLRPRKILEAFSRLYPEAWRQVDDLLARRKELGDWPDWCFLPLAGAYALVSRGTSLAPGERVEHVGILGALAAWRVTQGIYRFDPTTFDALWETPVTGDIPTEVLFHLPEWCVSIPTPRPEVARRPPPRLLRPPRTRRQRPANGVAVRPGPHEAAG